jgi:hypothetical protein
MNDITIEHGGKRYTLALNRDQTMTGESAAAMSPAWYLMLGPTALTTFPVVESEAEAALRARVITWLDAHPDLHGRDQIVLGGG